MPASAPSDKLLHLLGYAGLASILLIAMAKRLWPLGKRILAGGVVLPIYGALDEITQPLVNRHASLADWVFDVIGIAGAIAVHAVACRLLAVRKVQSA
jgi:VanZ family protein